MTVERLYSFIKSPIFLLLLPAFDLLPDKTRFPSLAELNLLAPRASRAINFVAQDKKPARFEDYYEPRIYLRGEVQTRENSWHDFFNAMVWYTFPNTKILLNKMHYFYHKKRYPDSRRTTIEDGLTLFDENGVVVLSTQPELLDLLREHRWHELFWQHRDEVKRSMRFLIFGHGLYEKALNPFIGITGKALLFSVDDLKQQDNVDQLVTDKLRAQGEQITPRQLTPLPILGIPGWWPDNESEDFYFNKNYFRSAEGQHTSP